MPSNWLDKILAHETAPPKGAWENIINKLDNEEYLIADLKTKMFTYEATPPNEVLENIFSTLDNEATYASRPAYIEKIYNYKQSAPGDSWKKIATELDKVETKVISIKKRRVIYTRITAAAAVIFIIAATFWFLYNKPGNAANETAHVTTPQNNTSSAEKESTTLPAVDNQEKKSTTQSLTYPSIKKATEQQPVDLHNTDYVKGNTVDELATDPALAGKEKLQNNTGETPIDITLMNAPGNYINITGPDGQSVKVSSKFSNIIGYLTDKNPVIQENLDIIIKESARWRTTFTVWRYKMTNNSIAPSFNNFMDIIELSKILEEKKIAFPDFIYTYIQ